MQATTPSKVAAGPKTAEGSSVFRGPQTFGAPLRRFGLRALALTFFFLTAGTAAKTLRAQEERRPRLPVIDKLASPSTRQAFSGTVQSLDLKRKLLNVNTVQGGNTEIFPVTKGVRVVLASGKKSKLEALSPGTNVLVYYDHKGDQRTVKEIVVLVAAPAETKKSSPPS